MHSLHPCGRRSRGFTLVEMLVVLLIILTLVGMSAGVLANSLRRSALRKAAADIVAASAEARQLAMQSNAIGDERYGVRVVDQDGALPRVEVVVLDSGSVDVLSDASGPIFVAEIPDTVILWQGAVDLRSVGDGTLEWWFAPGTGHTVTRSGSALDRAPTAVGQEAPSFVDADKPWGRSGNIGAAPVIAPAVWNAGVYEPGLSVRSLQNDLVIAVGVHAVGTAYSYEIVRE